MDTAKNIAIQHDGSLTLAIGKSRMETKWKNKEFLWSDLAKKLSETRRTGEPFDEYKQLTKEQQGGIKDIGGFVGGSLKEGRRKTENVAWRQLITLDADFVKGNLWDAVEMMLGSACVAYSTHSHSPDKPRLRLVIPLTRAITPDEYQAVSRRIAADIGIDFFDDTTYEPHRLMYWPSTAQDAEFVFHYADEDWLNPDDILARYEDWRDPSYWPESSRTKEKRQKLADKQGDPLEKPGMVGAFCRTYSITESIESFLADVYEPVGDSRYTYIDGTSVGGLVLYDNDLFAYSHHGTDPIGGRLVNAFDLVRIHKFGAQDEDATPGTPISKLPSYTAMNQFTQKDKQVRQQLGEDRLREAGEDFADSDTSWLATLDVNRNGKFLSTAPNILRVLRSDYNLKNKLAYNEFSYRSVILDDMPWRSKEDGQNWQDQDDSGLRNYIESVYGITGPGKVNDAVQEVQRDNKFHPIREYLNGLVWDGVERLDTLLIDYLGAADTPYTRTVTRKMMTAAVARVMQPGVKFDYVLVMIGRQGIGKSYLVKKLGMNWHSDSVSTMQGKEAYEQLQGAWLIELAELSATRKAEAETVKHFISKQEDSYRVAYGRQVSNFPRQCVFFGSTNDKAFLKDKTGNRRFWPVPVNRGKKSLWTDLNEHKVGQLWAEAVDAWKHKEELFLRSEAEKEAMEMQERHTEESEKFGLVQEYLDTKLPTNWGELDIGSRRNFIHGSEFGDMDTGEIERDKVCAMEVWVELFQSSPQQLNPIQAREINDILRRMPGWKEHESGTGKLRFGKLYGTQRAFTKVKN